MGVVGVCQLTKSQLQTYFFHLEQTYGWQVGSVMHGNQLIHYLHYALPIYTQPPKCHLCSLTNFYPDSFIQT